MARASHRRLVALASALGITAAVGFTTSAGPASAAWSTTPSALTLSQTLQYETYIQQLDKSLFSPSLGSIIDTTDQTTDLNRALSLTSTDCPTEGTTTTAQLEKWCWQDGDQATNDWVPQGITGVSDANADEKWGANPQQPVLVSWYSFNDKTDATDYIDKGVRISIIDPISHRYRHALLVIPGVNSNGYTYSGVTGVHAGGLAWYGNYLYVPDTSAGVRVFDMSRIFDLTPAGDNTQDPNLSTAPDADKVGRIGNTFYSYGYRYLIPQIGTWKQSDTSGKSLACKPASDTSGMRFSYLSIDRTTNPSSPSVVAGEYCSNDSEPTSTTGRLASWSLIDLHHADQYAANLHDGHSNLDGTRVSSSTGWMLETNKTQGAVHAGSHWYFVQSHGCAPSDLLTLNRSGSGWTSVNSRKVAAQSEDLYYWRGKNRIYSLTERNPESGCSQKRMIYSVNLD